MMNIIEQQLLSLVEEFKDGILNSQKHEALLAAVKQIQTIPFEQLTLSFLLNPLWIEFVQDNNDNLSFQFWYLIASYIKSDDARKQALQLQKIDQFCKNAIDEYRQEHFKLWSSEDLKKGGCHLQADFLNNPALIKHIYASNDEALISIIKQYTPTPRPHLFSGLEIPEVILKEQIEAYKTIHNILKEPEQNTSLQSLEEHAIKIQRHFRRRRRFHEELHRVQHMYHDFFKHSESHSKKPLTAEKFLEQANRAYIPQKCHPSLAARIIKIAQKIELYTTIRHITSATAIQSIFNDACYGRKNLQQFFIPFKPAALKSCDIQNGDGNVICFAPNKIDPMASGDIEIVLDLNTVINDHPAAFFKEFDLEYLDLEVREVPLKDKLFLFLPLVHLPRQLSSEDDSAMVPFKVIDATWGEILYFSLVPKSLMIAYDLKNMSQIMVLNFFRFIDELKCPSGEDANDYIFEFYKTLETMDDIALEEFLRKAASQLTQTAEFNFYGAYRLNFSAINTIRRIDRAAPGNLKQEYTLNMTLLKNSLAAGDLSVLEDVKKFIPSLLTSYRFLDFLITHTSHQESLAALASLREICDGPPWIIRPGDARIFDEKCKVDAFRLS